MGHVVVTPFKKCSLPVAPPLPLLEEMDLTVPFR